MASIPDHTLAPRKSPRQQRSRRTVDRILDAAARIFDELGYTATTTNDIADEAEVSIGSLYQYFPNKDAILVALARRHIEATTEELIALVGDQRSSGGFEDVLRVVLGVLVDQHDADDLHQLIAHTAPRTRELSVELDRAKAMLVDLTVPFLANRIRSESQRLVAARMVVAVVDAAVHDVILLEPRGRARRAATELTITTVEAVIDAVAASEQRSPTSA